MVDFTKMLKELHEKRAQDPAYQAHFAREQKLDETRREIPSVFSRLEMRGGESKEVESWSKTLTMRREPAVEGAKFDTVRFFGAPTGHEAFYVDERFVVNIMKRKGERFCLNAGTPGSWDRCTIAVDDVVDYLKEHFRDVLQKYAPAELEDEATPASIL